MNAPVKVSALHECAAVVFPPSPLHKDAMLALCINAGFGQAVRDAEIGAIPPNRIVFFMAHGAIPDLQKQRLLTAIRTTNNPFRRYAPVICLVPSGPRHQMVPLIEMGFDEVLFLSDPVEDMVTKLSAQLNHPLTYVQTAKYFGPDRRRIEVVDRGDPRRKAIPPAGSFKKIQVTRDPRRGIAAMEML